MRPVFRVKVEVFLEQTLVAIDLLSFKFRTGCNVTEAEEYDEGKNEEIVVALQRPSPTSGPHVEHGTFVHRRPIRPLPLHTQVLAISTLSMLSPTMTLMLFFLHHSGSLIYYAYFWRIY